MEALAAELREKGYPDDEEHCVIHAMFPQGIDNLYRKKEPKGEPEAAAPAPAATPGPAPGAAAKESASVSSFSTGRGSRMRIQVAGQTHEVSVEEIA